MESRFTEWNDVDLRRQQDGGYICFECKLNDDADTALLTVEEAVAHADRHLEAGHKMWETTLCCIGIDKKMKDDAVEYITAHTAISNNDGRFALAL